jgi:signal transduction histidine kinase
VLDVALAESDDDTVTSLARKLHSLNRQSVRIVDTLLDLANVENTEFVTEAVDLRDMIGHALGGIEAEATGARVKLSIQNTGPVIAPETFQLLTEPFYRGQGRTRRSSERTGHGLGLALAQAIAAAHGTQLVLVAVGIGGLAATVELPLRTSAE